MPPARWDVKLRFTPPPDMTTEQATLLATRLVAADLIVYIGDTITVEGRAAAYQGAAAAAKVKKQVKRIWVQTFGGDVRTAPGPTDLHIRRVEVEVPPQGHGR